MMGAGTKEMAEGICLFVPMEIPTVTHNALMPAKDKGGKLTIIKTEELRSAEDKWRSRLAPYAPERPLRGPVMADVRFCFPHGGKRENGAPHVEKPDADNIEKTFWDVLEKLGYIENDCQVFDKHISKMWNEIPGVYICLEEIEVGGLSA